MKYHKLVRDSIPEIITASGKICVTDVLSDEDYLRMLDAKLDEELAEYHQDQNIEELADLLEVLRACTIARGYTLEQLEQVRAEKATKRGGFKKKILLKEVLDIAKLSPLYTKKVDWSVFKDGFAIPLDVQGILQNSPELTTHPGDIRSITLIIEGKRCSAELRNLPIDKDKNPNHAPIIQIRYKSSDDAAERFRTVFSKSWEDMTYEKQFSAPKKHIVSERKDTFTMYITDDPKTFIVECHVSEGG